MNDPFEAILRPSVPSMEARIGVPDYVLDHGFVRLIDYMGDESAIVQAARVSYGKGTKEASSDRNLIRYLMRHWHTTPFEMCEIKLHVKLPIFVARQWIRHRTASVNEYSARYSILRSEFHMPSASDLARQSASNKQGRAESYGGTSAASILGKFGTAYAAASEAYESLLLRELARETAREVLPLATYTEWYWKVDLHNLLHFLRLRADPHAQKEIRDYADVICRIVEDWVPGVWEAFVDYRLNAHTFSRQEMDALKKFIGTLWAYSDIEIHRPTVPGASSRETEIFHSALGIPDET